MQKHYDPQLIEQTLYQKWEYNGYFNALNSTNSPTYSMVIPPPNVTGSLHMGHAFQQTLMDTVIRYQRMQGKNCLWQVGTDHAGIATQMVVERKLALEYGKQRHDYTREELIQKIWDWKKHSGNTINQQMRRLGISVDWQLERFTLDQALSDAVQTAFIRLYKDGLIYRGKRLVNWDPKLQTAISDLEIENSTVNGNLWYIRYLLVDPKLSGNEGNTYLVAATTRPETLFGDTALAVHPQDERYQKFIGQQVLIPLVNRSIPIIAEPSVDPNFASGIVKITPAHDHHDYEIGKKHQLPLINIFNKYASILAQPKCFDNNGADCSINVCIPANYHNLDRFIARKQIIAQLEQIGALESCQQHTINLPLGDRSGVPIEPLLTDQWYIKTSALAPIAIKMVKQGAIEFIPKQYENLYFSWMHEIQDWCISRQLWWGHRIPVWYDTANNVYVGHNEIAIREQYKLDSTICLTQDEDVLDTWFSSALWSFASMGWPTDLKIFKIFHPTNLLITGFDILFFWVARMIMLTAYLIKDATGEAQVPFKQVYITGLIRDEKGQKMSKSKGNVLDPIDIIDGINLPKLISKRIHGLMQPQLAAQIEQQTKRQYPDGIQAHGTDALRFTLAALANSGRDIHWDMGRLAGYRNFCNKLWNASRFVLLQTKNYDRIQGGSLNPITLADRWILSELQHTIQQCHLAFNNYRFDQLAQTIYEFTWNSYCDWYLEIAKVQLSSSQKLIQQTTRKILTSVLEQLLRLAHPLMPFITETVWLELKKIMPLEGASIVLQRYPECQIDQIDLQAATALTWVQKIVNGIRHLRCAAQIKPTTLIPVLIRDANNTQQSYIKDNYALICKLAQVSSLQILKPKETVSNTLTHLVDNIELLIPMDSLMDIQQERARLTKALQKVNVQLQRSQKKLSETNFITHAPEKIVVQENHRLKQYQAEFDKLQKQLAVLDVS